MNVRRWALHLPALLLGIVIGMASLWAFQRITAPSFVPTSALSSVVKLERLDRKGNVLGYGTGFVIGPGLVATAYHCIEDGHQLVATDWSNTQYVATALVTGDPISDVALVRFPTCSLPPLRRSTEIDQLKPGDSKLLISGHPNGGRSNVVEGLLAEIKARFHDTRETADLHIQAVVAPGSSGSPVVHLDSGEVVAIAARYNPNDQLCFAVTLDELTKAQNRPRIRQFPGWANAAWLELRKDSNLAPDLATFDSRLAQGDYLGTLQIAERALERHPNNAEALRLTGASLSKLGRWEDALPLMAKATKLSPEEGIHWHNYAIACFHTEDYTQGLEPSRRSLECVPQDSYRHFLHAFMLDMNGKSKDAKRVLAEANAAFDENLTIELFFKKLKGYAID